jgi:D-beta-D-heptose 7-phosphate kinase/D-beta-D-heptose 1-phosphate adenosyltransferase
VLVVGDAMVDAYHFGTTTRISPEAPIPVVKITDHQTFHGGAANVFTNLVALGAEVRLRAGEPTPIKNRLMVGTTQVARWDTNDEVRPILLEQLDRAVLHWTPDAIVVSDYGKGSISEDVIKWINNRELPTYVDTKGSPGVYKDRFTTLFPNAIEYDIHKQSYDEMSDVIFKRGAEGIDRLYQGTLLEHFRAYATNVVSVCGAGDAVIAAYAYFAITGDPAALFKASIAAAIVVEKPWTATASLAEINERIKCLATKKV